MRRHFEELDYCPTPIGTLSLRRRFDCRLGAECSRSSSATSS